MNKHKINELEMNLLHFIAGDRHRYPTAEEVAKALGIKPRTVRRALDRLARRDYLFRTQINKKPPSYKATLWTNDLFAHEFAIKWRNSESESQDNKMDTVGKDGVQ
jgi:predicted transcriptional regulator of viral defense system